MTPPHFSVLILSHNKWPMVCQAIESVMAQTYGGWDILVVDSGCLLTQLRGKYWDNRYDSCGIRLALSKEPPDLRANGINPAAWVLNRFMPQLKSDWSFYICDDDYLLPTYMEAFAQAIMKNTKIAIPPSLEEITIPSFDPNKPQGYSVQTARCFVTGQIRAASDEHGGLRRINGVYHAAGRQYTPGMMDRQVDYLQFMHDRWLWEEVRKKFGTAYPEELSVANHGDGIFMERAVSICPALPVPGIHCVNRRTPFSQFCGTGQ